MTCCLFNNLLFQGGYKAVRKWMSSWEEQRNWGNWGNHNHCFAIFAAAQHYHLVMSTYRGSDEEHLHCLSPLFQQCLHPALGYSSELPCLPYLTDWTASKSDLKNNNWSGSDKQIDCFEQPGCGWQVFIAHRRWHYVSDFRWFFLLCICAKDVSSPHNFQIPLPKRYVQDSVLPTFISAGKSMKRIKSHPPEWSETPLSIPCTFPNTNTLSKILHWSACVLYQTHQMCEALLIFYF